MAPSRGVKRRNAAGTGIVLLASTLYFPNVGGVENSLAHLSEAIKALGFRPWLFVSTGGDPSATKMRFEVRRIRGVPVLRYRFSSLAVVRWIRAWLGLRIFRRRFRIVGMISRDEHSSVAAMLVRQPCVYVVPGIVSDQHKPRGANPLRWLNHLTSVLLQRIALARVPRVAVFSRAMVEAVEREVGRTTVELVRPGISRARFSVLPLEQRRLRRREVGLPADVRIAVAVGRFTVLKRFDLVVEALVHLPDSWHLVLVGDGPERQRLQSLVQELGLVQRVHFVGQVTNPETYLQIADVYVLSSEKEAFGQVLIEAMACGLPIAAFDPRLPDVDTATREIVPGEWLFEAAEKRPEALARAVAEAVEGDIDPNKIARRTVGMYSWEELARQLIEPMMCSPGFVTRHNENTSTAS